MEEEAHIEENDTAHVQSAGEELRAAREAKGMELAQVAAETRIPQRHLESIETGAYHKLPSRTYAIGFTRTYARTVGLDEKVMIGKVRDELAAGNEGREAAPAKFEPGDPARVPSGKLAWFGALAAVLLLVGGYAFYSTYFAPGLGPAPLTDDAEQEVAAAQEQPGAIDPDGEVVFTSEMDGTWVNFYEADGTSLFQAQMDEGDSFTIPADATDPQVWTGRPYALRITVGGREVPKISEEDEIVRDVPISARALLARGAPSSGAAATPTPRPAATQAATAPARRPDPAPVTRAPTTPAPSPTPSARASAAPTPAATQAPPRPAATPAPSPSPASTPAPAEAEPDDGDGDGSQDQAQ